MDSLESKLRSTDRLVMLKPKEGGAKTDMGITDTRLFTGDNKLHLKMDPQTCFWSFQYDKGITPEVLKQKFTGFKAALKFAEDYYRRRNIDIVEIKD